MTTPRYRTGSPYAATATALILSLPPVGDIRTPSFASTLLVEHESLGEVSSLVADAVSPAIYSSLSSEVLSSFLLKVAANLVAGSRPLDADFAAVIDREFWNLL